MEGSARRMVMGTVQELKEPKIPTIEPCRSGNSEASKRIVTGTNFSGGEYA
jgi:hypothetical protein